ncbi:uncharacterized protein [Palaemon carinicauda]|uniref:uncharacterized protein n=1 Tax=Palaemon carinicauda TaxID=392227 RepID=UPI0035B5B653
MKRIMVHATDTDVLVLDIVTTISMKDCELWLAFGHGTHFRYIRAHVIASELGNDYCRGLPFMNAISGCGMVSSFSSVGAGISDTARCMSGHVSIHKTRAKFLECFYWKNVSADVRDFVTACDRGQKVNPLQQTEVAELHPVPVPSEVMLQIGVDITNMPKTEDGYCCVVDAMDYFSKWPEAHALKVHTTENVAKFLLEKIICRHGCVIIQINDQGREFVNQVSSALHDMTCTKQLVSSPYHPQANGLVELHNRTIKDSLAVLPVELQHNQPRDDEVIEENPDDCQAATIAATVDVMTSIQDRVFSKVTANINTAQQMQKMQYNKRREHASYSAGDIVLLKNLHQTYDPAAPPKKRTKTDKQPARSHAETVRGQDPSQP